MMKKCGVLLIWSLLSGLIIQSADKLPLQKKPRLMTDFEKKNYDEVEKKLQDSNEFWPTAQVYFTSKNTRDKQIQALDAMDLLLVSIPSIFASSRNQFTVTTQKNDYTLTSCSPLLLLACIAHDSKRNDTERLKFEKAAQLDKDPYRRRSVIQYGIRLNSPYLVHQMLQVGTSITYAPEIMGTFINQCTSAHKKHLQHINVYNQILRTNRTIARELSYAELLNLHHTLIDTNKDLQEKECQIIIRDLLFQHNANLSCVDALITTPHLLSHSGWICESIVAKRKEQLHSGLTDLFFAILTRQSDAQFVLPQSHASSSTSSSSTSSSSSSSTPVPGHERWTLPQ
jgi:hypothetical protein